MSRIRQSLQENLLTILCFSKKNSLKVSRLLPPNKFDGIYRVIATYAIDYVSKYKKPPEKHISDLLELELLPSAPQANDFKDALANIFILKDSLNEEFAINKLSTFLSIQNMREGLINVAQKIQDESEESLEEAEAILAGLRQKQLSVFDPGIYFGSVESLNFLSHQAESFSTAIPSLDHRKLGPTRKELHLFMGILGKGKTWWLIHLGKTALRQRVRVCHITLEVSADIVLQRYYQSIFAIAKRTHKQMATATWETDELGRITSLNMRDYKPALTFDQHDIRKELQKRNEKWGARLRNLIVKEFPTSKLTVPQLSSYLDTLYDSEGFIPDLLLLDYADLMHVDSSNYRLDIGRIYKELRGISVERNIAVATVSQSNRKGIGAKRLTEAHIGEDVSKLQTADVAFAYNQTDQELKRGLARLEVIKARNEEGRFTTLLAQNYAAGQFCLQSTQLSGKAYWTEVGKEDDE